MDWGTVVSGVQNLLRGIESDLMASEQTRNIAESERGFNTLYRCESEHERQSKVRIKRKLIDLRKRRELLLAAPAGTPGVEQALRNIEAVLKKVK